MSESFALAFAGGGTRGAYQVGACNAISESDINITAVTGTSIGAINGAFAAVGDTGLLEELYDNIKPDQILDNSLDLDFDKDIFHISNFFKLSGGFIKSGGYRNTPLRKLLEDNLDIDRLYDSEREYGMVTFEIGAAQVIERFKDEIPKEQMIDHILASASLPIFKAQRIKSKIYTDGGIANNLPVNMLIRRGYKSIIAVDLHGIGIIPPIEKNDVYIKTIRPTVSLGGLMEFNSVRMKRNKLMGYLDTRKALGSLQGEMYFFEPDQYSNLISSFNVRTLISLEAAAEILGLEKYNIFSAEDFLKSIYDLFNKEQAAKEDSKLNVSANKKRLLVRMVNQAKSSPLHNTGIESAIFTDVSEAALAILELEQYFRKKQSDRLTEDHP